MRDKLENELQRLQGELDKANLQGAQLQQQIEHTKQICHQCAGAIATLKALLASQSEQETSTPEIHALSKE